MSNFEIIAGFASIIGLIFSVYSLRASKSHKERRNVNIHEENNQNPTIGDNNTIDNRRTNTIQKTEMPPAFRLFSILVFAVSLATLLFVLSNMAVQEYSDNSLSFCDCDQGEFGILVLPFQEYGKNKNITLEYEQALVDKLDELKEIHNLPIIVKRMKRKRQHPGGGIQESLQKAELKCAKAVIWGGYDSSEGAFNTSKAEFHLGIIDPDFFLGNAENHETLEAAPMSAIDLKVKLESTKLGTIAYLVGALTAYHNGNFKAASSLSEKVNFEDLPRDCGYVDNMLSWSAIQWYLGNVEESENYALKAMSVVDSLQCSLLLKAKALDQLANVKSSYRSEFEQAIIYSNEAIAIVEGLAETHDSILSVYYTNLATSLFYSRKLREAIDAQKKSINLVELANMEKKERFIGNGLVNLAASYLELGEYDTAIEHLKKGQKLELEVYPEIHHTNASTLSLLSKVFWRKGNYQRAIEHQLEALAIRRELLPLGHKLLANSYHNIAVLQSSGHINLREALNYEEKAIRIIKTIAPVDTMSLATMYERLFDINMALNNIESAKDALDTSYELKISQLGTSALEIPMIYTHSKAIEYYFAKKMYDHAIPHIDTSLKILEPYRGRIDPKNFVTLEGNKAKLLALMGDCANSRLEVLKVKKVFGLLPLERKDAEAANFYELVALLSLCEGALDQAMIYAEKSEQAYSIKQNRVLSLDIKNARVLNLMAKISCKQEKYVLASSFNAKALDLLEGRYPNGYYILDEILEMKETISSKLKDSAK